MIFPDDYIGKVIHGDCLEVMRGMPDGCVDLVLTDPPYGLGNKWTGGKSEWPLHHGQMGWDASTPSGIPGIIRLGRHAIIWGGHLYPLPISRSWFIWDKKQNDKFTSGQAELAWTNLDIPIRTFRMSQVEAYCNSTDKKVHPTQKPINLITWCIGFAPLPKENNIILDPFCGSGTTLVAAKMLGRRFIGIDIEKKYCDIAEERLRNTTLPLPFTAARTQEEVK
jgi:DNA modification methylase